MLLRLTRVPLFAAACYLLAAVAAAPAGAQPRSGDPVWGAYAAGLGYPVNSPELQERAAQDGIDPRCLMTVTVAWMEHPRVVHNVGIGLFRPLVEGVTLVQAQQAMYDHSAYFNNDIDCMGARDEPPPPPGGGPAPGEPPPGSRLPSPDRCPPQQPSGDPDLETGPGFIVQWHWNADMGGYCGYLRQGGGLHQYTLEPSGNGYYLVGFNRATSSYERVMRMDRGPAPAPNTGWVESGKVLRINPDGTLREVGWWFGRLPQ